MFVFKYFTIKENEKSEARKPNNTSNAMSEIVDIQMFHSFYNQYLATISNYFKNHIAPKLNIMVNPRC